MPKHKQHAVSDITSSLVLTTNYNVLNVDASGGNVTITLPALADMNNEDFVIRKVDSSSNQVIIDPNGAETINGDTTLVIVNQYSAAHIISGDTEWGII